jgi:outer membrane biosynthesis protein TonB
MIQSPIGSSLKPTLGALLFAILICLGLLLLMAQTQEAPLREESEEIIIRPLNLSQPPPPPPQQQQTQKIQQQIKVPSLASPKTNSKIFLETTPIDVPLELDFDPDVVIENSSIDFDHQISAEVGVALQTSFDFADMDKAPRLMHGGQFRFNFPKDLIRRNITQGKVELSIEIDTAGKARILSVVSATYQQLIPIAKRMVSMAKFSIPTVDGKNVKVIGVWPVVLQAPR